MARTQIVVNRARSSDVCDSFDAPLMVMVVVVVEEACPRV